MSSSALLLADSGLQVLLVSGLGSVHLEPEPGERLWSQPAAGSASAAPPEQWQWLQGSPEPAVVLLSSEKGSQFGAELVPAHQEEKAITKCFGIKLSSSYISALQKESCFLRYLLS